jgi:hypothetical protein
MKRCLRVHRIDRGAVGKSTLTIAYDQQRHIADIGSEPTCRPARRVSLALRGDEVERTGSERVKVWVPNGQLTRPDMTFDL